MSSDPEVTTARLKEALQDVLAGHDCELFGFECCTPRLRKKTPVKAKKNETSPVSPQAPKPKRARKRPQSAPEEFGRAEWLWNNAVGAPLSPSDAPRTRALKQVSNHHVLRVRQKLLEEIRRLARARHRGNVALWSASLTGEVSRAEKAVQPPNIADIDAVNARGLTPLMIAARWGHVEVVDWLLRHRAEVDREGKEDGGTALHCAQEAGTFEVVLALVEASADMRSTDKYGRSVLMRAAAAGNSRSVQWLVAHMGQEALEEKDENGWTPIMHGSQSGSRSVVRALMERGADVSIQVPGRKNQVTACPITIAIAAGHSQIANLLHLRGAVASPEAVNSLAPADQDCLRAVLSGPKNSSSPDNRADIVLKAAAECKVHTLRKFLDPVSPMASPNVANDEGMTALLILAAIADMPAAVLACLEFLFTLHALDKHVENLSNCNAFLLAARSGTLDVMKLLAKNGVDVHSMDDRGRSAAMCAVESGDLAKTKWLLATQGHSILHDRDNVGQSAVLLSIYFGKADITKYLLTLSDVDVDDHNDMGVTLLMLAGRRGYLSLYKQLAHAGANMAAVTAKKQTVVEYLQMCFEAETRRSAAKEQVSRKDKKKLDDMSSVIHWHQTFVENKTPKGTTIQPWLSQSFSGKLDNVAGMASRAAGSASSVATGIWKTGESVGTRALAAVAHPGDAARQTRDAGLRALESVAAAARSPGRSLGQAASMVKGSATAVARGFAVSNVKPAAMVQQSSKKPRRSDAKAKANAHMDFWMCSSCDQQNCGYQKKCWSCLQERNQQEIRFGSDVSGIYEQNRPKPSKN